MKSLWSKSYFAGAGDEIGDYTENLMCLCGYHVKFTVPYASLEIFANTHYMFVLFAFLDVFTKRD